MKQYLTLVSFIFIYLCFSCIKENKDTMLKSIDPGTKELIIPIISNLEEMYPVTVDFMDTVQICRIVYDTLISNGQFGSFRPRLANNWTFSKDRKIVTFFLRKGIHFHNGTLLKARHIRRSILNTINHKNYQDMSLYLKLRGINKIKNNGKIISHGIKIINDYTIQFLLREVNPNFISFLTDYRLSILLYDPNNKWIKNIGSGSFKIKQITSKSVELIRNSHFYLKKPKLDKVVFSADKGIDKFKLLLENKTPYINILELSKEQISAAKKVKYLKETKIAQPIIGYFYLNPLKGEFKKKQVREAFFKCFDKKSYVHEFYKSSHVAKQYIPKGVEGNTGKEFYIYSVKKGNALLRKAAYNNEKIVFVRPYVKSNTKRAQQQTNFLARMFQECGLNVLLKAIPFNEYSNNQELRKYHGVLLANSSLLPSNIFFLGMRRSSGHLNELYKYYSPNKDKLIDQIIMGSYSGVKLRMMYEKVETVLLEEYSLFPFLNRVLQLITNDNIKNFPLYSVPFSNYSFEDVDIKIN